ncbi:MAG: protein of unknown function DUF891 [uncultured bacterium]|uniref:Toxin-antitoxin system, toxin component, RelE family n=4 Tax=Candidatus Daviesiibacteriota TaxID=1752718 RepID=A0A0G0HAD7_9BACT|nr:MAG: protein of unknown function DUF891 [uncultured bacterium]KKQ09059.1 MAG: Toxin-antitoxin system, toxin component, RelE family [Candidatus Daviesbacteria bacterium GW2011_GWB1_36_5]KKQ16096.1 MAG: Toxin-antitoxin system, toxin component, RelE family [Candidatus Daviesbacteria bacterium GW2011_GWA1_36_8]OGE17338.1 MAG: hypothetical protein A2858_03295 [Candidatus Daviesbacteria bacterium RIFCSPHIGHO2_01_FULL_36_37]OGE32232.1 MAG: hypothetical protein A3C99_02660 [Candidatus Daviesbacteria
MDKWQVIYFKENGANPVSDFLDSLNSEQQSKVLRIFHHIKEYGLDSAIPHLRKLTGTPFWEIRVLGKDNIRVIYVVPTEKLVLALHGFVKKKQKTPSKEIEIASRRY